MDQLQILLTRREEKLRNTIREAEEFLKIAPDGSLRVDRNVKSDQYYIRTCPNDTHGTYIKKKNKELIRGLAQKEYEKKMLVAMQTELNNLVNFKKIYNQKKTQQIWNDLIPGRKKWITPHEISDDEFVQIWAQEEYSPKKIDIEDEDGIFTERGEQVRSKSEKILADKFLHLGIPYYYEKPLELEGYGMVYPDFTLLNISNRTTIYWEHLGLMDNPEYCEAAIKKIETMQRNHIFQGVNLILTYETSMHPLNMKSVDGLIKEFLL